MYTYIKLVHYIIQSRRTYLCPSDCCLARIYIDLNVSSLINLKYHTEHIIPSSTLVTSVDYIRI